MLVVGYSHRFSISTDLSTKQRRSYRSRVWLSNHVLHRCSYNVGHIGINTSLWVILQLIRLLNLSTKIFTDAYFLPVFKAQPPLPPSPAQAVQRENDSAEDFIQSIKRLFTNVGYLLLLLSYAINVGIFYAISTLLNQIVLEYFPVSPIAMRRIAYANPSVTILYSSLAQGHEEDAGRIGLTIVCAGMLGSVVCGVALDKTHKYKWVSYIYIYIKETTAINCQRRFAYSQRDDSWNLFLLLPGYDHFHVYSGHRSDIRRLHYVRFTWVRYEFNDDSPLTNKDTTD